LNATRGLGERVRRAAKLIVGTRIKAARPFPLRDRVSANATGARDGPDMDVAVVDVPTVAAVRIGSSGSVRPWTHFKRRKRLLVQRLDPGDSGEYFRPENHLRPVHHPGSDIAAAAVRNRIPAARPARPNVRTSSSSNRLDRGRPGGRSDLRRGGRQAPCRLFGRHIARNSPPARRRQNPLAKKYFRLSTKSGISGKLIRRRRTPLFARRIRPGKTMLAPLIAGQRGAGLLGSQGNQDERSDLDPKNGPKSDFR